VSFTPSLLIFRITRLRVIFRKKLFLENKKLFLENKKLFLENKKLFLENKKLFLENKKLFLENKKLLFDLFVFRIYFLIIQEKVDGKVHLDDTICKDNYDYCHL
jgi:hypothetical protein